jgi:hypothetical protein
MPRLDHHHQRDKKTFLLESFHHLLRFTHARSLQERVVNEEGSAPKHFQDYQAMVNTGLLG